MNIIDNEPTRKYMQLFNNEKMCNKELYTPKERRDINRRIKEINRK